MLTVNQLAYLIKNIFQLHFVAASVDNKHFMVSIGNFGPNPVKLDSFHYQRP